MTISTIKAILACDIRRVWNRVTSLEDSSWRRDLDKIEILLPGKQFIEHPKQGCPTLFTITLFEPYKRYEFDMENENMKGHWIGLFSYVDGQTQIEFTENVAAKKFFLKPFVKTYLKKQQIRYMKDLENSLGIKR